LLTEALLLFGAGLALLVAGAELLVRGASRLASSLGVAPLFVGLTVVAWGTSAPELAVNIQSTVEGVPGVALGNAVGSNIFNVLFVLGLSAVVAPLVVARQIVRRDVPLMIAASLLFLQLALDGEIERLDGIVLLSGLAGYTGWSIWMARREPEPATNDAQRANPQSRRAHGSVLLNALLIPAGLVVLALGSRWLVEGSVAVAEAFGVSRLVVGLTIVAAGTSLPEAATSVVAGLRGERDIAAGNVIGSNIFNILGVLGVTAVIARPSVSVPPAALRFDVPVMIAVAVACLPITFTGHRIARWEGVLFLAYYLAFVTYVVLDAAQHDALPGYLTFMRFFAIPITVVTLLVVSVRAYKEGRRTRIEST
jgi:cation:H+ antiporter